MSATAHFDLSAIVAAVEARDAAAQLALYAPDAVVHDVSPAAGPSAPAIATLRDA